MILDPIPVFSVMGSGSQCIRSSCRVGSRIPMRGTHEIIRNGLRAVSPMYTGVIEGVGPRYCPSIEDKIHRFADQCAPQYLPWNPKDSPQTMFTEWISTSLPFDVQLAFGATIPGLEQAHTSAGLRDRIRLCRSARLKRFAGNQGGAGFIFRGADQWHDRLSRSGGARHAGRLQRGASPAAATLESGRDEAYLGGAGR